MDTFTFVFEKHDYGRRKKTLLDTRWTRMLHVNFRYEKMTPTYEKETEKKTRTEKKGEILVSGAAFQFPGTTIKTYSYQLQFENL